MVHGPINYALLRHHGLLRPVEISSRKLQVDDFPIRLIATRSSDNRRRSGVKLLSVPDRSKLVLVREEEFGEVVVRDFDLVEKGSSRD
ncbi:MAG: hypothetical protein CMJ67_05760 [Planctomycetaceae bacterium]|nr:hypothetical protein [Planctomycetaceae bacterium]